MSISTRLPHLFHSPNRNGNLRIRNRLNLTKYLEDFRKRREQLSEKLTSAVNSPTAALAAALEERLKAAREREYVSKFSGDIAKLDAELSALKATYSALKEKLNKLKPGSK